MFTESRRIWVYPNAMLDGLDSTTSIPTLLSGIDVVVKIKIGFLCEAELDFGVTINRIVVYSRLSERKCLCIVE